MLPSHCYLSIVKLTTPVIFQFSETAWLIQFQTGFDVAANKVIHQLATWFLQHPLPGQSDIIPAYDCLMLCFSASNFGLGIEEIKKEAIEKKVEHALARIHAMCENVSTLSLDIPVYYDTTSGGDLHAMSMQLGISADEIIHVHCSRTYHVFMLGFLPGFCYMGEVDSRIAMPRKSTPAKVKAGAIGIAGFQTGIYPLDSPGGWHILGHTPLKMFDALRTPATLVQPGMQVAFVPISFSDYQSLLQA